jgi:surface carbohydrate biosynthesis protein (TIGR04326 family)
LQKGLNLLIIDCDSPNISSLDTVVYWSKYTNESGVVSVPFLIKKHSEEIKKQYLSWIYELGQSKINGKSIIEHLKLRDDFSFWWLTLFTEKCNYDKSKHIDQVLKVMALNIWLNENHVLSISLNTDEKELNYIIKNLCKQKNIIFKSVRNNLNVFFSIKLVPLLRFITSLFWLFKYLIKNFKFLVYTRDKLPPFETITFFSYFLNLNMECLKSGEFKSHYWGVLPDIIIDDGIKSNWIHFFLNSGISNRLNDVEKSIEILNTKNQRHYLFESFIDLRVIVSSIFDWLKLISKYWIVRKGIKSTLPLSLDFWPYFKIDLIESIFGVSAIDNLLRFNNFIKISNFISKQNLGIYLQENQGWEISLAYSWKKAGNNNLIGFPHSTVRYWDLRYFHDSRNFNRNTRLPLPLPDYVACSGPVIKDIYTKMGYSIESLIEVEALRYLNFEKSNEKSNDFTNESKLNDLLVLGDYIMENTVELLTILYKTIPLLDRRFNIIFKPHPACLVYTIEVDGVTIDTSFESIDKLLVISHIALTSSTTSASVDAYLGGNKVISVYNGKTVDFSPFYNISGIDFISNEKELAFILNNMNNSTGGNVNKNIFFYLDNNLPKWKKMIKELI